MSIKNIFIIAPFAISQYGESQTSMPDLPSKSNYSIIPSMILDGKRLATKIQSAIKEEITHLDKQPVLAVCLVGEDPASQVYVNKKIKTAEELGIKSICKRFPANITQDKLEQEIELLNQDKEVNGILLQLPLPQGLDEDKVLKKISPIKDVDGLHIENLGLLFANKPQLKPCTPYGIMSLLQEYNIELSGKRALIIGRSRLVGNPVAQLLLHQSATVTIAHSKTSQADLLKLVQESDIIIVAVGRANFLKGEWLNSDKQQVLIDVGINRLENKLVGDIDYNSCKDNCYAITPVPGGVGPLTVAHLMKNTLTAFRLQQD